MDLTPLKLLKDHLSFDLVEIKILRIFPLLIIYQVWQSGHWNKLLPNKQPLVLDFRRHLPRGYPARNALVEVLLYLATLVDLRVPMFLNQLVDKKCEVSLLVERCHLDKCSRTPPGSQQPLKALSDHSLPSHPLSHEFSNYLPIWMFALEYFSVKWFQSIEV